MSHNQIWQWYEEGCYVTVMAVVGGRMLRNSYGSGRGRMLRNSYGSGRRKDVA